MAFCSSSMNLKERAFLQEIGDRIRDRRLEMKLTQAELGEKCGLHRTFIGSVERGERNIALLNLRQIALALRIQITELFDSLSSK
jgi:transcriptional regulator with XRE-family HTH domain